MSTYVSLYYHLIFSTKNRVPIIDEFWRLRLHAFLGGTVNGLDGRAVEVGGIADHVHLLVGLTQHHCLKDFMRELKKNTSGWVHDELGVRQFAWQEGYGAFTVSAHDQARVRGYIRNQEDHHAGGMTYISEFKGMLDHAHLEYDPKYLE